MKADEIYEELQELLKADEINIDDTIYVAFNGDDIVDWYFIKDGKDSTDVREFTVGAVLYSIEKNRMPYDGIRYAREALGWSRQELANYTWIPVRTLQGWEQGQRTSPLYVERWLLKELNRLIEEKN